MSSADTIFALATAPGKSGVAVIRISGKLSLAALEALTGLKSPKPREACYTTFRDEAEIIDHGLALYFNAPRSFTGEDVVECHTHGSRAVIQRLLSKLGRIDGLRMAEPGEFTRRAFANGKMDLMEAEGLADLIDAETDKQRTQALRQMQGELSVFYDELRDDMLHVLAHLEAYIDFPDEDIPESVLSALDNDVNAITARIAEATADSGRGERLRDGIQVVIVGAPNAGKSSLLNAIAKRDAAIVSFQAGTTRDVIEVHLDIAGYPVILVDTAGIRDSQDIIEAEGIRRAKARAQQADIKLVLCDSQNWPDMDNATRELVDEQSIIVITKCDLKIPQDVNSASHAISIKTGEGLVTLLRDIEERVTGLYSSESHIFITRQRHRELLLVASELLKKSNNIKELELRCEELRRAAQAVGKITGKIQVDEVLGVIFSSFCIGK